uniref:Cleavage and polyadenylation specificity factor subunit 2 n=1 Tax=Lygus hesperus TaxID=30085 RepID=A0A0A9YR18_LYGHE
MTSIIKLHALSGAMDESPPCYILQIDDFRFLLDCGWNEKFDLDFVKELKRHVHMIDAVLISYPDPLHLGALPYLVGKCGLSCPVYATIPVYKMGQMFMYDLYQSHYNMEDFTLFNLDDVDAAFDKVVQLKYNQTVQMKGKGYGLSIVPMPAGHMLGGTMWKIQKMGEEDVIYAVDFNHKKERHLNGCDLDKVERPSLLITDAFNATYQQARRRSRDEKLMTLVLQTLSNNGNILIAVDTAGRVLELAHMLDQLWRNKHSGLQSHPLCLLNNVSYNVVEFAKSQIEWMSEKLMKNFEAVRNNPFQFKHIRLCHSVNEVLKLATAKVVVLASMPDLECGFAHDLFLQWAPHSENTIILTSRSGDGTLGAELLKSGSNRTMKLDIKKRVRLEGEELAAYLRAHETESRQVEEKEDSSDDELELLSVIKSTHDLVVKSERRTKNKNKKTYPMYPVNDGKIKFDDYGELVKIEDYKTLEGQVEIKEEKVKVKEEEVPDAAEIPTKCVKSIEEIAVNAQVQYIDFEGRSDGESMQKLITQLKPHRLILVRGTKENTEALANHVKQWTDAKVFTPSKGDMVDATSETHIYQIRLTDAMVSSMKMQKAKETEVAWLDAVATLRSKAPDTVQTEEMEVDDETSGIGERLLSLEPIPLTEVNPHDSVFINELKLSDLKQILTKHGIDSEFSGGVLWCCNRTIAVKRQESRKVSLEGWISDNYYKVRDILYNRYAIV